jgi:hypothetical protein
MLEPCKDEEYKAALGEASVGQEEAPPLEMPEIFVAVQRGDYAKALATVPMEAQYLFEMKGPPSSNIFGGRTLLMLACWQHESRYDPQAHFDCTVAIAQRSTTALNLRDLRGMTALMLAASAGKTRTVKYLVSIGCSILWSSVACFALRFLHSFCTCLFDTLTPRQQLGNVDDS